MLRMAKYWKVEIWSKCGSYLSKKVMASDKITDVSFWIQNPENIGGNWKKNLAVNAWNNRWTVTYTDLLSRPRKFLKV